MKEKTCKQLWAANKAGRIADIRKLWSAYTSDPDASDPDLGNLSDYGLSFEYHPTDGDAVGHFRWVLGTGGPADEFRFYVAPDFGLDRVEYWYLDWWDGYGRSLAGADWTLLLEIWGDFFRECDAPREALRQAGV